MDKFECAKQFVTVSSSIILFMDLIESVVNEPPLMFTAADISKLEDVEALLASLSMFDAN